MTDGRLFFQRISQWPAVFEVRTMSVQKVCVYAIDVLAVLSGAVILAAPFILVVAAPFYFGI